jgi:hypothetical protein
VWAHTPSWLEGSLVEVLLTDGQSALGHLAGFADDPVDEETVDLVLCSEWQAGPAGARIATRFEEIGPVQILTAVSICAAEPARRPRSA